MFLSLVLEMKLRESLLNGNKDRKKVGEMHGSLGWKATPTDNYRVITYRHNFIGLREQLVVTANKCRCVHY